MLRSPDPSLLIRVPAILESLALVEIDDGILGHAGIMPGEALRSLDAIHLATAEQLRDELTAFVTYDKRLASHAHDHGLPVATPA
jgi:predicted nucleic acid-binding protein